MLVRSLMQPPVRRSVAVAAAVIILGFAAAGNGVVSKAWFTTPVSAFLAQQAGLLVEALLPQDSLPVVDKSTVKVANLNRLAGADVYVIFLESYGATVIEESAYAKGLSADFAAFEKTLTRSGWQAASAFVDSPTFGGGSWLAHASLLTGVRVASEAHYRRLLASSRKTLAQRFQAAGYRTVALLPGLKRAWPEGRFYGFDQIYDAAALDYPGPAIGWWAIPDQYSLFSLHRSEVAVPERQPLFIFFATIMSHMPFAPLPPYQPDWPRLAAKQPYSATAVEAALQDELQLANFSTRYLAAIRYNLKFLAGYLSELAPFDAVFLVLGDHQPLAQVSGPGASWSVPVHVITRNKELLSAFREAGFEPGLIPKGQPLGGIDSLHGLMLRAFESRKPSVQMSGLTDAYPAQKLH